MLASARLTEAGIAHVVLEKNADVGGSWYENTYPGRRRRHPQLPVLVLLLPARLVHPLRQARRGPGLPARLRRRPGPAPQHPVRHRGRGRHVRPGGPALARPRDQPDDGAYELSANAVISAVGVLNRRRSPRCRAWTPSAGPLFHSAQWPDGRRPDRQAGGARRRGRQRDADRPGDRRPRRDADGLPALTPVDRAQRRVLLAGRRARSTG